MNFERTDETQPEARQELCEMRELQLDELEAVGGAARRTRAGEGATSGPLHWFFSLFT